MRLSVAPVQTMLRRANSARSALSRAQSDSLGSQADAATVNLMDGTLAASAPDGSTLPAGLSPGTLPAGTLPAGTLPAGFLPERPIDATSTAPDTYGTACQGDTAERGLGGGGTTERLGRLYAGGPLNYSFLSDYNDDTLPVGGTLSSTAGSDAHFSLLGASAMSHRLPSDCGHDDSTELVEGGTLRLEETPPVGVGSLAADGTLPVGGLPVGELSRAVGAMRLAEDSSSNTLLLAGMEDPPTPASAASAAVTPQTPTPNAAVHTAQRAAPPETPTCPSPQLTPLLPSQSRASPEPSPQLTPLPSTLGTSGQGAGSRGGGAAAALPMQRVVSHEAAVPGMPPPRPPSQQSALLAPPLDPSFARLEAAPVPAPAATTVPSSRHLIDLVRSAMEELVQYGQVLMDGMGCDGNSQPTDCGTSGGGPPSAHAMPPAQLTVNGVPSNVAALCALAGRPENHGALIRVGACVPRRL